MIPENKRILIVGAGSIGSQVAKQLNQQSSDVTVVRKSQQIIDDDITHEFIDISEPFNETSLVGHYDFLLFCVSAAEFSEAAYDAVYLTGLKNLLAHFDEKGITIGHGFYVSSTAVYHQMNGEWVDETSPTQPRSFSGKILLQAEALFLNQSFSATVLRFSGIYGPQRYYLIKQARHPIDNSHDHWTNRVHLEDCIGVIQFLMDKAQKTQLSSLYLVSDDQPVLKSEVLQWIKQQLPPNLYLQEQTKPSKRRGNRRCRNDRIKGEGYQFRYPSYYDGYLSIVQDFKIDIGYHEF